MGGDFSGQFGLEGLLGRFDLFRLHKNSARQILAGKGDLGMMPVLLVAGSLYAEPGRGLLNRR